MGGLALGWWYLLLPTHPGSPGSSIGLAEKTDRGYYALQ